jgi:hypothetical protein
MENGKWIVENGAKRSKSAQKIVRWLVQKFTLLLYPKSMRNGKSKSKKSRRLSKKRQSFNCNA